jgi:uncharacterized protein (DUF58 family)
MRATFKEHLFAQRAAPREEEVFDPTLFAKLDRMRLRLEHVRGGRSGETPVRGSTQESGIEIESFKSYTPGDDIRHVDWNAVGRLDQLLTRRFVAEREIPVHLLLDASASMGVPAADGKFLFARRLIAALAYIALNNNDPVRVVTFWRAADGPAVVAESPLLRHRGRTLQLRPFLSKVESAGQTALSEGIERYLERRREPGVALVVSDFLVPAEIYERALHQLCARRLQVQAVQVVGREERDLAGLEGRLRLRDSETGALREVALSAAGRRRYAQAFAARIDALRRYCHRCGIAHAVACAADGVEHCLTRILPASGVIRLR